MLLVAIVVRAAVILCFSPAWGQISWKSPFSQPTKITSSIKCCSNESSSLLSCILPSPNFNYSGGDSWSSLAIVSYSTVDILDKYAKYAIALHLAFAQQHGYKYFPFVDQQQNFDPDPRWNKCRIILNAIDPLNGWAKNVEYVLWLDSDLIILDFSMKIELIADENKGAHIFISKDMARASFVANSGFILVRNTEWARNFMKTWWDSYDRKKCCDQNAFTWIYDQLSITDKNKIHIMPASAVNSDFPSWIHQSANNQVLHLAGCSSLLRRPVFQEAFERVCAAASASGTSAESHLPLQLGLSRARLQEHVRNLVHLRYSSCVSLEQEIKGTWSLLLPLTNSTHGERGDSGDWCQSSATVSHRINGWRKSLEDILKFDDLEVEDTTAEGIEAKRQLEATVLRIKRMIYQILYTVATRQVGGSDSHAKKPGPSQRTTSTADIELLNDGIASAFELVIAINMASAHIQFELRAELPVLLDDILHFFLAHLEERVPQSVQRKIVYYRFKHHRLLASFHQTLAQEKGGEMVEKERVERINSGGGDSEHISHSELSTRWLRRATQQWEELHSLGYYGTEYVMADPYKEGAEAIAALGTLLCMQREHQEGVRYLQRAVGLYNDTVAGFSTIKIATTDDIVSTTITFAETMINAAMCFREAATRGWYAGTSIATTNAERYAQLSGAAAYAREVIEVLQSSGLPGRNSELYRTATNILGDVLEMLSTFSVEPTKKHLPVIPSTLSSTTPLDDVYLVAEKSVSSAWLDRHMDSVDLAGSADREDRAKRKIWRRSKNQRKRGDDRVG